jgi:hypothetical protein
LTAALAFACASPVWFFLHQPGQALVGFLTDQIIRRRARRSVRSPEIGIRAWIKRWKEKLPAIQVD